MGKMISSIDQSLLEPIGRVTVNFSMLEGGLKFFISILIGSDQRIGQIITAHQNVRQLIDLLGSLYKFRMRNDSLLTEFEQIRKSLEEANDRRNTLIHSQWASGNKPGESTRFKTVARAKKGLLLNLDTISIKDIDELSEFIAKVASDVHELMFKTVTAEAPV
jgi:hypothetical protein